MPATMSIAQVYAGQCPRPDCGGALVYRDGEPVCSLCSRLLNTPAPPPYVRDAHLPQPRLPVVGRQQKGKRRDTPWGGYGMPSPWLRYRRAGSDGGRA